MTLCDMNLTQRLDSARRPARLLFALWILFFVLAPAPLAAQSGRRKTEPSSTPDAQRQRRTGTNRPASDNAPGQPATPDAPGATTPTPTPRPIVSEPVTSNGTDEAIEIDENEIVRVNSNLVPVSATVTDTRGKAITDLTADDFELRVDGQPKPIGGLSHAETPVRLVLLFDNSKSIRASREFEKQAAIRFFKSVLRPVDQAAIYSVETLFSLEQPLTNDVSKLVRTIEQFPEPDGATKLLDAMAHAAEYLRLAPGRKVLVIVSDGTDTVSNLSFDETLRRVVAADCQVYAVQTGTFESANLIDLIAVRRLETFSDRTGGAVYTPKTTGELDAAFTQIAADLAQQYVLSYYPTDEGRDGRFRSINLRVKTRPNVRVRARRGYYPRRGSSPQLSSLPGTAQEFSRSEPPSDLNPPLTLPREIASNARSTIALGGPVHGNKNMDPETSGDAPARTETDLRVRPTVKAKEPTSSSPEMESSPDTASASEPTPPSQPSPTPAPTATPTSTRTAPAKEADVPARQLSQAVPKSPLSVGQINAKAVKLPRPFYPEAARRMNAQGAVRVEVLVDESGKVISARAVSGHMLLRGAAVSAARQAAFTPVQVSGQPVRVSGYITYNFSL